MDSIIAKIKKNRFLSAVCLFIAHLCGIWRTDDYIVVGRKVCNPNIRGIRKLYYEYKFRKIGCKLRLEIGSFEHIGDGFKMSHATGIAIHKDVHIGQDCHVFKGVSIGTIRSGKRKGVPTVEDRVVVCANAVVVGNITIGHDTLIAANAFVDFDVPPHSVVIGNPGVIHHKENASADYL